jgi:hypothetical protein
MAAEMKACSGENNNENKLAAKIMAAIAGSGESNGVMRQLIINGENVKKANENGVNGENMAAALAKRNRRRNNEKAKRSVAAAKMRSNGGSEISWRKRRRPAKSGVSYGEMKVSYWQLSGFVWRGSGAICRTAGAVISGVAAL